MNSFLLHPFSPFFGLFIKADVEQPSHSLTGLVSQEDIATTIRTLTYLHSHPVLLFSPECRSLRKSIRPMMELIQAKDEGLPAYVPTYYLPRFFQLPTVSLFRSSLFFPSFYPSLLTVPPLPLHTSIKFLRPSNPCHGKKQSFI